MMTRLLPVLALSILLLLAVAPSALSQLPPLLNITVWQTLSTPVSMAVDPTSTSLYILDWNGNLLRFALPSLTLVSTTTLFALSISFASTSLYALSRTPGGLYGTTAVRVDPTTAQVAWSMQIPNAELFSLCSDVGGNVYVVGESLRGRPVMYELTGLELTFNLSGVSIESVLWGGCAVDGALNAYIGDQKVDYSTGVVEEYQPAAAGWNETIAENSWVSPWTGDVYVDHTVQNAVVRVNNATGALIRAYSWGDRTSASPNVDALGFAVDNGSTVYAYSYREAALKAFADDGELIANVTLPQGVPDMTNLFLTVDAADNVYAQGAYIGVVRLSRSGVVGTTFTPSPSYANGVKDVAVDSAGFVYLASATAQNVQKFDPTGVLLETFTYVVRQTEATPVALCPGSDGTLWVADGSAPILIALDTTSRGSTSTVLPMPDDAANPSALIVSHCATDAAGNVYVTQPTQRQVLRFNANGTVTLRITATSLGHATPLVKPTGIAVSPDGSNIFIGDALSSAPGHVLQLDQCGQLLRTITPAGGNFSVLAESLPVALTSTGDLLVADANSRVVVFEGAVANVSGMCASVGSSTGGVGTGSSSSGEGGTASSSSPDWYSSGEWWSTGGYWSSQWWWSSSSSAVTPPSSSSTSTGSSAGGAGTTSSSSSNSNGIIAAAVLVPLFVLGGAVLAVALLRSFYGAEWSDLAGCQCCRRWRWRSRGERAQVSDHMEMSETREHSVSKSSTSWEGGR